MLYFVTLSTYILSGLMMLIVLHSEIDTDIITVFSIAREDM